MDLGRKNAGGRPRAAREDMCSCRKKTRVAQPAAREDK